MSYDAPDVYYQPEAFGLRPIGMLSDPDQCYGFNDLAVWQHTDGRVFFAHDAGCSCYSPFQDFTSLDDLDEATAATWAEFQTAVDGHCYGAYEKSESKPDRLAADKTQLLSKVSAILRDNAAAK